MTGASTGIGLETARELARRGVRVYMACRNMTKCEEMREKIETETKNPFIRCRECDLSSMKSIRGFVKKYENDFACVSINS